MLKRFFIHILTVLCLMGLLSCGDAGNSPAMTGEPATTRIIATNTPLTIKPTYTTQPTTQVTHTTQPTNAPIPTLPPPTPDLPKTVTFSLDNEEIINKYPANYAITIHFSEAMDPDSVEVPITFSPDVAGNVTWSNNNTTLTFTPATHFTYNRIHIAYLDKGLTSYNNTQLTEDQFTFYTLNSIIVHTPYWSYKTNNLSPTFEFSFNRAMNKESVRQAFSIEPAIPYTTQWVDNDFVVTPSDRLDPDQRYTFEIAGNVTDSYGLPLDRNIERTYQTLPLLDEAISLESGAFTISFNYPIAPQTFEASAQFRPDLAGNWLWEDETHVTFQPSNHLRFNANYYLSFADLLTDLESIPYPLPDTVTLTTPAPITNQDNFERTIHPVESIKIVFAQAIDKASVDAIEITPEVAGTFQWDETATTLTLFPEAGLLEPKTTYTIQIGTDLRNTQGETLLDTPYIWNFNTSEQTWVTSLGTGPRFQLIDSEGKRNVLFLVHRHIETTISIPFRLYQSNLEEFLTLYPLNKDKPGAPEVTFDVSDHPLVYQWTSDTINYDREYNYNNAQEVIIPTDVPTGFYILETGAGEEKDQLYLIITENSLVVKQDYNGLTIWASDLYEEANVGMPVTLYDGNGNLITTGTTNEQGVFRYAVDFSQNIATPDTTQPQIVVAQQGDDVVVAGIDALWLTNSSSWWGWRRPIPPKIDFVGYIYTDRPIYRPDQAVHFKIVVREDDDAVLTNTDFNQPITATIKDARNNTVQTYNLTLNDYGTANTTFNIADGAMLGNYTIVLQIGNDTYNQIFKVQEYRKPDYEVEIIPYQTAYIVGDDMTFDIFGNYFSGEPLVDGDLSIHTYQLARNWYYYGETNPDPYRWYDGASPVNTGPLDEEGKLTFSFPAETHYYDQDSWQSNQSISTWAIEASVDDGSNQIVSGYALVNVYKTAEEITLDRGRYVHDISQPLTIEVTVTDIHGNPVPNHDVTLDLSAYRYRYSNSDAVHLIENVRTDDAGNATVQFTVENAGYYRLDATSIDSRGKEMMAQTWVYLIGENTNNWYSRRNNTLRIDTEQESYAPGDTAQLLIESPMSGPALLTFERGTTRREILVELTAPLTIIDVPILETDIPNIFVTVNVWENIDNTPATQNSVAESDSQLRKATVEIKVPATERVLNIEITPDQESYASGDTATITMRVTNFKGEPVAAELSLAMVDEAIFSLSDDLSKPIYDAFYFDRINWVQTYDSFALDRILWEGGRGGGGGGGVPGNPRADFPDTAEWFPVLRTDANGEVQVTITLPDNITSWRLTAKAVTGDTQVGEAITNFTTNQDVVIRPSLPRHLTAGDQIEVSTIINNFSDETQTLTVYLHAGIGNTSHSTLEANRPGPLRITDIATQTITLAPNTTGVVGWQAIADKAGEATLTLWANFTNRELADAIQLPLTIHPLAIPDIQTEVGDFTEDWQTTLTIPDNALEMSSVRLELSSSIAGTILPSLEYLTGYPYGCVEQTMSRALPNAVVARAFNQLGMSDLLVKADLDPKIQASIQRLYGFQHDDGGWGWWYNDDTHDYQTAWVLFGLATTAEAGYEVDPDVLNRAGEWLYKEIPEMDIRTRAFALYSLSLIQYDFGNDAQRLAEKADELDAFSQAALALALNNSGNYFKAQEVMDLLLADATTLGNGMVYWRETSSDGYYRRKTMASDIRSTALALSALTRLRPNSDLETGVVRWLMSQRKQQGWGTTNETSFAILGLTDHLLQASLGAEGAGISYTVELNGEIYSQGTLDPNNHTITLDIPYSEMQTGTNELHIRQDGNRKLYYVLNKRTFMAQTEIEQAGNIRIWREYRDPTTGDRVTEFTPGQLVEVKLIVQMPQNGSYMIIEDQLPGGMEALNEGLENSSHDITARPPGDSRWSWRRRGYNYKEIRDDRVSFFVTDMGDGQHTFTYYARATTAGIFVAMPTEVYAMYDLSLWGRSASHQIQVIEE